MLGCALELAMIIHMFGLRWQPAATPLDKARTLAQIQAFQGVVPACWRP